MVITSMDINNKEFKKSLRGYDCDEVDEFLDKISEDYEIIYKENSSLKEKIEILEERLKHYVQIEENIQKTLLLAQNAAEQAKTAAQSESELIIRQANETAQKIIDKAHNDVIKIHDNYETLKQEFLKFRAQFKGFMKAQLDTFNSLEKELMKNYNVGSAVDVSEVVKPKEIENESLEEKEQVDDDLDSIKSFFVKEN
ncbi:MULTISPECIES: DivIVA domain-containing protein [Clostridium]|uniref:Septum site-determining protein DivIVA n=2 Tax=Clostridium TaxID=1485 RepID=A0A151AQV8_9CLOT|nr:MULTISPECIES: DivIVA domain-containing protein [Clostridium]KYH29787.1 septum site-determining protein DivIVA [Clostridium colicanis DSM 13634]MBE6044776.1 DivIVA domain-containing protein [Clostridium thermopalmarium]PRR75168.1 Septum site-determining protein DivIVA [Clostridium thermopalmarium DSM 5974]PVZ27924.1 cell division initiation protein [Clostridium thermopalmarium DSM 5974]